MALSETRPGRNFEASSSQIGETVFMPTVGLQEAIAEAIPEIDPNRFYRKRERALDIAFGIGDHAMNGIPIDYDLASRKRIGDDAVDFTLYRIDTVDPFNTRTEH
jgi:hypothetical protein